jgi:hypothetical protein
MKKMSKMRFILQLRSMEPSCEAKDINVNW